VWIWLASLSYRSPAPTLGLSEIQVAVAVVGKSVELRGGLEGNVLFEACTDPDCNRPVGHNTFIFISSDQHCRDKPLVIESQQIFPFGHIFLPGY
jgi:hypothetical protein